MWWLFLNDCHVCLVVGWLVFYKLVEVSVLVQVLILFPNIWLICYLSGHVILSDRAAEFSQLGADSAQRTAFPSPVIKELVSWGRSDISLQSAAWIFQCVRCLCSST